MAWPFPGNGRGADACVVRYAERADKPCLEDWRDMERKVAIVLLVVPLGVFLWKVRVLEHLSETAISAERGRLLTDCEQVVLFLLSPGFDTPWLPSTLHLPEDENHNGSRHAITFRDVEEQSEADSLRDEVTRLNNDSNLASRVESGRVMRPSPLIQESGVWERE